jgi:hypothetical protein
MKILPWILLLLAAVILIALGNAPGAVDALGDMATALLRPVFVPIVVLINQPAFAYLASGLLFTSALVLLGWYLLSVVLPRLTGLRRARLEIAGLPRVAAEEWFVACERVQAVLGRNDVLTGAWSRFADKIVNQRQVPAQSFASEVDLDALRRDSDRGSFLSLLPGYYTSVGLILTFVGLVAALYFSARGFRSGDINEARQAIVALLNASAFKFLSSVAALAAALLISVVYRMGTQAMHRATVRLTDAIDRHLDPLRFARPASTPETRMGELTAAVLALSTEMAATRASVIALRAALDERASP